MNEYADCLVTDYYIERWLRECKKTVSVALPICEKDVKFVFYSFPLLAHADIDELVVLLDGVSDFGLRVIRSFTDNFPYKVCFHDYSYGWENRIAGVFHQAYDLCSGDYIFSLASDVLCDPSMLVPFDSDLASFEYKDLELGKRFSPHTSYMNLLRRLPFIYRCKLGKWSGVFGMKSRVWRKVQFRDVSSPDLQFFNDCAEKGFSHKYVRDFQVYHLRSGIQPDKQFGQGVHRAKINVSPLKVVAHSLVYGKPFMLLGYLREKLCG